MLSLDPGLNIPPQELRSIHLMGICGTGMAALAGMLLRSGYTVTGSDDNVYPPMSDFLAQLGIEVSQGYSGNNLMHRPDLVIVGNVIRQINVEAQELARTGLPYLSFPQALAHFFIRSRHSIVVSGTHGKTTTCGLLAGCLQSGGLDPSFMIGGIVREFNSNFRLGQGKYFVVEGDEYDAAFFDKHSKFLHYLPEIAILTSIEFDHADIFDNLDQIKNSFRAFVRLLPANGLLVANYDDENVVEICREAVCEIQSYGKNSDFDWSLAALSPRDGTTAFDICHRGRKYHSMEVKLPGEHNCLNSLAATAVLHHIGVEPSDIGRGLLNFGGVKRRQEVRFVVNGVTVIDDFAHHPTAVNQTLAALKAAYPGRRLIAVFEPRTNSSRRSIFQEAYGTSFAAADLAVFKEPMPLQGFSDSQLFSSARLARDVAGNSSTTAESYDTTDQILERLGRLLRPGDVVAVLSNGGFDNIHKRLEDLLNRKKE